MNKKQVVLMGIMLLIAVAIIACDESAEEEGNVLDQSQEEETLDQEEESKEEEADELTEEKSEDEKMEESVDPALVKANELGEVMVLMYHHIDEPEDTWVRTPDNFRRDLQELYDRGFRPVSLEDYATGNIEIDPGYKPVVLTFDDGRQNNFNMIENSDGEWEIDSDSAVGILTDFHEEHPDFPLEATFFINGGTPFEQEGLVEYKLNYIVDQGMDIGNHSYTHANFNNLSAEKLQYELGRLNNMVLEYLPDYEMNTLALPFGSRPKDEELMDYLHQGEYDGIAYENIAVLEVGWDPYLSPFHENFNPLKIRRVRASEMDVDGVGIYDWLGHFESGARTPYVSDGSKETISYPSTFEDRIDHSYWEKKELRSYDPEE
ncbi:polysaccharide deacetylase family protein [Isachenkonia alkalipeptolytica]|uniref:Polysaccharide deacetylase n=1 Tax=Isachenkonia alkalipeptolytica TaxID=2565777 RepID=A0AA43XML3_9CLOT|nr:polysaccharide deacetylase family protein [Isachenkonia alkalipeptolytica]NBG89492.1 polysaccharide deacetylase [Isachenkonia alkalipeptolytica]